MILFSKTGEYIWIDIAGRISIWKCNGKNALGYSWLSVFPQKTLSCFIEHGGSNICNYFSWQDLAWTSVITALFHSGTVVHPSAIFLLPLWINLGWRGNGYLNVKWCCKKALWGGVDDLWGPELDAQKNGGRRRGHLWDRGRGWHLMKSKMRANGRLQHSHYERKWRNPHDEMKYLQHCFLSIKPAQACWFD